MAADESKGRVEWMQSVLDATRLSAAKNQEILTNLRSEPAVAGSLSEMAEINTAIYSQDDEAGKIGEAVTALLIEVRSYAESEYQRGLEDAAKLIEPETRHSAYAAELYAAIRALKS